MLSSVVVVVLFSLENYILHALVDKSSMTVGLTRTPTMRIGLKLKQEQSADAVSSLATKSQIMIFTYLPL